ncbi:MAG: S-layer homology domain-containing protein [Leptolyngbya sp.]|nr:S-layer homology domain-containing protein [Leptolyngbya sp.]
MAIIALGLAAGITGIIGRRIGKPLIDQSPVATEVPVDRILVPGWPNPLQLLHSLTVEPAPPPEIPRLVLPQPLPPQEVWPESPNPLPRPYFRDGNEVPWVAPILDDLAQRRLIQGFPDGTFRPQDSMTRAEFATQLSHLFVLPPQDSPPRPYPDVDPNHWAMAHIQNAVAMGFLAGYPDHTFGPEDTITRIQVVTALAKGLNLQSSRSPDQVIQVYQDADQVPPWAKTALMTALEANLVVNYPHPQRLEPNREANRAEVIAMLRQALVYTGQLSPLPPNPAIPADQPVY